MEVEFRASRTGTTSKRIILNEAKENVAAWGSSESVGVFA